MSPILSNLSRHSGAGQNLEASATFWIPACAGMTDKKLMAIILVLLFYVICSAIYIFEISTACNLTRHSGAGRNPETSTTYWIPACAGMTCLKLTGITLMLHELLYEIIV